MFCVGKVVRKTLANIHGVGARGVIRDEDPDPVENPQPQCSIDDEVCISESIVVISEEKDELASETSPLTQIHIN